MRIIVLDTKSILEAPALIRVTPTYFYQLITADPDDNKFVDCAICGNAEVIVSNDSHFNVLKTINFPKVKVVKLEEFIASLTSLPY